MRDFTQYTRKMQLEYLYIREFRSLKDIQFNLRPGQRFEYDPRTNVFTVTDDAWYEIDNFFSDDIINITAIVGDNRVGKTTLLEYIPCWVGNMTETYLAVINGCIVFNGIVQPQLQIRSTRVSQLPILPVSSSDLFHSFAKNGYAIAFFANTIYQKEFRGIHNFTDFSTRNLLRTDFNSRAHFNRDQVEMNKHGDLVRQIRFLSWAADEGLTLPFQPISTEFIGLYFLSLHGGDRPQPDKAEKLLSWCVERMNRFEILGTSRGRYILNENVEMWKEAMAARVFRYLVFSNAQPFGGRFMPPEASLPMAEAYLKAIRGMRIEKEQNGEKVATDLSPYMELIKFIDSMQEGQVIGEYEQKGNTSHTSDFYHFMDTFQCRIRRAAIEKLLPSYIATGIETPLFEFAWGLSSGEWAFLNILSRVRAAALEHSSQFAKRVQEAETKEEAVPEKPILLLLFDEPCLHFHPEWQRNLIKHFVDLIPKMIDGWKCQIIFTTHSPLTTADLPKEHVVLMQLDDDGRTKIRRPPDDFNTFGGDPFTLYRKGFGIKDGFFSGFARDKMEEYFAPILKGASMSPEERSQMLKFANMVGDEFVKDQLLQLIDKNGGKDGQN